jgi:hypothetical protein
MSIYTLPGFLSPEECSFYREVILKPQKLTAFTDSGHFTNNKYVDLALAERFFEKLKTFNVSDSEKFLRPNKLIMTGFYKPGDQFGLHTDTGLFYDQDAKQKSRWTLLIYLNTVEGEGATVFYDGVWKESMRIYPKEGTAVLFDIDLWHKGEELRTQKKFWIGCEIIGSF